MNEPFVLKIISGHSKQGKTTVIEKLVSLLKSHNLRVGTVKDSPLHEFDTPGKDTQRHLNAGSDITMVLTPTEIIFIQRRAASPRRLHSTLYQLNAMHPGGLDVILLEGFREASYPYPAIIVAETAEEAKPLVVDHPNFLFITGPICEHADQLAALGHDATHVIPPNETSRLWEQLTAAAITHIQQRLPGKNCETCGYPTCQDFAKALWEKTTDLTDCAQIQGGVQLEVDGKVIPLVGFVQNIIANGVYGMVTSLKGVPQNPKGIKISIQK